MLMNDWWFQEKRDWFTNIFIIASKASDGKLVSLGIPLDTVSVPTIAAHFGFLSALESVQKDIHEEVISRTGGVSPNLIIVTGQMHARLIAVQVCRL